MSLGVPINMESGTLPRYNPTLGTLVKPQNIPLPPPSNTPIYQRPVQQPQPMFSQRKPIRCNEKKIQMKKLKECQPK